MDLNALSPVTDINTSIALFTAKGYQVRPELFYQKQLLDTIRLGKDEFVHYRYADTRPIQGKAAKLQLRRWSALNAHTVPLAEGIPPQSDKGTMESYELGVNQYGRFMEFTDKVEWEIIDPIIAHYTAQYSIVALETLDVLAREALHSVPNHYFAGMATGIGALTIGELTKPSLADLRIIVHTMKKRLVKPRGSNYHVIGTPDFTFDMVSDPLIEKFMTINQTTKTMYQDSKLPAMFDMEFYETMHTDNSSEHMTVNGTTPTKAIRVYRYKQDGSLEYATVYELTAAGAPTGYYELKENIYTGDGRNFADAELNAIPELGVWNLDKYNTDNQGAGEAWEMLKIDRILVLGKDCLIRTNIEGKDNAKMYVKPLGSAGVLDPINQRQSIGFKIDAVGFGVERNEAVAVYHCVPSQLNA